MLAIGIDKNTKQTNKQPQWLIKFIKHSHIQKIESNKKFFCSSKQNPLNKYNIHVHVRVTCTCTCNLISRGLLYNILCVYYMYQISCKTIQNYIPTDFKLHMQLQSTSTYIHLVIVHTNHVQLLQTYCSSAGVSRKCCCFFSNLGHLKLCLETKKTCS